MAVFIPISKSKHARSAWIRPQHYGFAAATEMVPLLAEEADQVMPEMSLAFRLQRNPAGKVNYQLVALLSPLAGRNLLVKSDGSWLSGHVPVQFRGYPFRLLTSTATGEQVVCFDQASGLLTEAGAPGSTPFFEDNGEPSSAFKGVLVFLQQYEQRRVPTQQAVDALAELNLIIPWPLVVQDEAGKPAKGAVRVHKVDGAALQKLSAEPLFQLHQCGALPIAYAQLLSEPRVQHLGTLLQAQGSHKQPPPASSTQANFDAFFAAQSDVIKFGKS